MRAHAFLRFSSSALVAGALLVAGCTGGGADIAAIKPTGVTEHAAKVDDAARKAANTMVQRLERVLGKEAKHKHDPRPDKVM